MNKTDKDEDAALAFQKMFGSLDEFVADFKESKKRFAEAEKEIKEIEERMNRGAERMPGTLRLPV